MSIDIQIAALYHPYIYLFLLSTILSIFVSYRCFTKFDNKKLYNKFFIMCTTSLGLWAIFAILQLLLEPSIIHIYIHALILIISVVYAWSFIMFIYYYTDTSISKNIAWGSSIPLLSILVITLISFYINFDSYNIYFMTKDVVFFTIPFEQSLPFQIMIIMQFIYGVVGLFILGLFARRQKYTNKNQYYGVITAMSIIVMGAFISALRLDPYPEVHIYPAFFVIFFLVIWKSIYNDNFFTILPIARTKILENLNQGVIVVNNNKKIIDFNKSIEETICKRDLYMNDIFDVCPEINNKNIDFTQKEDLEEVYINNDYYNVFITPLFDNENDYIGSIISFENITELKQKTKQLKNQNDKLENFASVLSHDIRNPLAVSKGYTDLIEEEPNNEEYHEKLSNSLDRIENIIDDILKLTKEGNNLDELKETDLETIANESWGMLEFSDATLEIKDSITFKSDKSRLKNVLENIFRNSEDHSPDDIKTKVIVGALSNKNGFYIEDNGNGIPKEKRNEVFKYSVSNSNDGTGLGLAIVKEIINAHDWNISIKDGEELNGARFEIIFE